MSPSAAGAASTLTSTSSGTTAMSSISSTAKEARPVAVPSRRCSASTCTTSAVEDSARQAPTMKASRGVRPKARMAAPITSAQAAILTLPMPKTSRRMVFRRSKESSSPIMNSRKTTPSSATCANCSRLSTVT